MNVIVIVVVCFGGEEQVASWLPCILPANVRLVVSLKEVLFLFLFFFLAKTKFVLAFF